MSVCTDPCGHRPRIQSTHSFFFAPTQIFGIDPDAKDQGASTDPFSGKPAEHYHWADVILKIIEMSHTEFYADISKASAVPLSQSEHLTPFGGPEIGSSNNTCVRLRLVLGYALLQRCCPVCFSCVFFVAAAARSRSEANYSCFCPPRAAPPRCHPPRRWSAVVVVIVRVTRVFVAAPTCLLCLFAFLLCRFTGGLLSRRDRRIPPSSRSM
jgi:hypothetical protein